MCIVAIAWQLFEELPLVLLSNRDEFFARPTNSLHQWSDQPVYAGRDEKSGGSWLGIHQTRDGKQNGRWAAVLNFRDGVQADPEQRSRGDLVTDYLTGELSPMAYARQLDLQAYAGFNLIVGDSCQAVLVNNRGYPPTPLFAGLHVLSNGQPDSEWFKCERLRGRVRQEVLPLIAENSERSYWQQAAYEVMSDRLKATDEQLPHTGMPIAIEQMLSPIYIEDGGFQDFGLLGNYGTRSQSILTMTLDSAAKDTESKDTEKSAKSNTAVTLHLTCRERTPLQQ